MREGGEKITVQAEIIFRQRRPIDQSHVTKMQATRDQKIDKMGDRAMHWLEGDN